MNWTYVALGVAALGAAAYRWKEGAPDLILTTIKEEKGITTVVVKDTKKQEYVYYLDGKHWHNNKDDVRVPSRLNEKLNELLKSYHEKQKNKKKK
jgi:membrane protein implicated in regulation of membrane protease activity